MSEEYSLESYQFHLPDELIAQHPVNPRDASRLMVVDRKKGTFSEVPFSHLLQVLESSDRLVFNNTKVIPARLRGKLATGGTAEVFLTRQVAENTWQVLVRPGKKLKEGGRVYFAEDSFCEVLEALEEGERIVKFFYPHQTFDEFLSASGEIPLPHYIRGGSSEKGDEERYQTVYAKHAGAVAAPTAGLHFTPELIEKLHQKGVERSFVTLHVGPGTFKPVQVDDIRAHKMHNEEFWIEPEDADAINHTIGRVVAVGTTSCRSLETSAVDGKVVAGHYNTDIFIYPGYTFKRVDCLLTNFHLPGSTLLMLVSAFMGRELAKEAYQKAIKDKFRFYSYGDAMLIL